MGTRVEPTEEEEASSSDERSGGSELGDEQALVSLKLNKSMRG